MIVHTNLGRAPLAAEAIARVEEVARGYSNLEYDLTAGARGSRQDHVADILRRLTGAEAALVVNNNAAAVLLALAALAEGREVLVSRGELIEIGDGFRIPDVLARSGARLREVGTTNRTRAADYENAIGADTALILRVHQSNFRVVGFTELPPLRRLAQVAQATSCRSSTTSAPACSSNCADEPSAKESLAAGADLVTLLGRQAARRAAGRHRRRTRRPGRASPPASAPAGAARGQAHARRARGNARSLSRRARADPRAAHARATKACAHAPNGSPR